MSYEWGSGVSECVEDYTVIDLETTGLSAERDEIIEVSAIRVRNHQPVDTFTELVNPGRKIDARIVELTGITDDMLIGARTKEEVLPEFLEFIGSDIVVGHNVSFDLGFIRKAAERVCVDIARNDYIDTLRLSRRLHPELPHHRLGDMVDHFCIVSDGAHRADADTESTRQLYELLCSEAKTRPEKKATTRAADEERKAKEVFEIGYGHWKEGEVYRKAGVMGAAIKEYDLAKAAGYDAFILYESYAKVYRKQKEYEKEIAILEEGISRNHSSKRELQIRRDRARELLNKQIANQAAEQKKQEESRKVDDNAAGRTPKVQKTDGATDKRLYKRPVIQYNLNMSIVKRHASIADAVRESGVNPKSIRDAANGVQRTAGGFVWRYADEQEKAVEVDHEEEDIEICAVEKEVADCAESAENPAVEPDAADEREKAMQAARQRLERQMEAARELEAQKQKKMAEEARARKQKRKVITVIIVCAILVFVGYVLVKK